MSEKYDKYLKQYQETKDLQWLISKLQLQDDDDIGFEHTVYSVCYMIHPITSKITYFVANDKSEKGEDQLEIILQEAKAISGNLKELRQQLVTLTMTRERLFTKLYKRKLFDIAQTLTLFIVSQMEMCQEQITELYYRCIIAYDKIQKNFEQYKVEQKSYLTQAMY